MDWLIEAVFYFLSGRGRLSRCWMGLHAWSVPGGHCERCGLCDDVVYRHEHCRAAGTWPNGGDGSVEQEEDDIRRLLAWQDEQYRKGDR